MSEKDPFFNYIDQQIEHFPKLLTTYHESTRNLFFRAADTATEAMDVPSLLSMDKTLKVNGLSKSVGKDDENYDVTAVCPQSGELNIVSVFQSIYHVPLGAIEVIVEAKDGSYSKPVTLDQKGEATVTGLEPGKSYLINVNHEPTESELDALFSNYDAMGRDIVSWLEGKWVGFKPQWNTIFQQTGADKVLETIAHFGEGLWDGIKQFWQGIVEIYNILKDPEKAMSGLFEGADKIIAAIKKAAEDSPSTLEKAYLFATDEAAAWLVTNAILTYLSMIPAQTVMNDLVKMGGTVVVDIILGIIGGIILAFIAGPQSGIAFLLYRAAKTAGNAIKAIITPIITFFKEIFSFVETLINKASDQYKRIAVNNVGGGQYHNGVVKLTTDNKRNSQLVDNNTTPDSSKSSTNDNAQAVQDTKDTKTNEDPISMVTGEELLSITDGHLPGLIAFDWQRFYRTSSVDRKSELGYGWSHALSHSLTITNDSVIWQDQENKTTTFPKPSKVKPIITNTLAKSAIYLSENSEIVIQDTNGHFYYFDVLGEVGQLKRVEDKYGHKYTLERNKFTQVIESVTSQSGLRFKFSYAGELIRKVDLYHHKEVDGAKQWVFIHTQATYEYNASQQLIRATNANGDSETYTYDQHNVIQSRQLAGGVVFSWEWQGEAKQARAIRQFDSLGNVDTSYEWDDESHTVVVKNNNGTEQIYQHDENARLIKEVDASGGEYHNKYDLKGRLVEETDAVGNSTSFLYDDNGDLLQQISPSGLVTNFSYIKGHIFKVSQGKATWQYSRDKHGNVLLQTDPLGNQTHYSYNSHGLIEQIQYPDGSIHKLSWNKNGELIEEQTAAGELKRYRYDILGRLRYRQDSLGITEYHFDKLDRLTKMVCPGGKTRLYEYNAYNKVTKFTDEQGRTTEYQFELPYHQVGKVVQPDGSSINYKYDSAFNFVSEITNESGDVYQIEYAPTGHVQKEITFDGREFDYEYDAHTQLIAKTEKGLEGNELTTQYQYDSLGNLSAKTLPDGQTISYKYDAHGRLCEVDDGHWPLAYKYDLLGRLVEEHQSWATLGYQYDAIGNLTGMLLPDGQLVTQAYHHGLLSEVALNGELLTQHQYLNNGLEATRKSGNLSTSFLYDELGRLTEQSTFQNNKRTFARNYSYTDSGNLAQVDDLIRGTKEYHYDPLDRLTIVRGDIEEQFIHDPAGSLLRDKNALSRQNQILIQGDRHYAYDEFGNLARESRGKNQAITSHFEYDSSHRLEKISKSDGSEAHYKYDAFGRRIEKSVVDNNGVETKTEFLWFGDKLLSEICGEDYKTYLYEPDTFKPLALIQGEGPQDSEVYYYQLDHLGTPLELRDGNGAIAWQVEYKAYGNLARKYVSQIESPLRFQGQYYDEESGLHYNRHRYYNPDSGSFITPDPIGLAGGLNNYQYAVNPTGWIDPLGLKQVEKKGIEDDTETIYGPDFQKILSDLRGKNFATPHDGSVFWTGYQQGNQQAAMKWAKANGKSTIEMTPGGKWLEGLDLYGPNSPVSVEEADNLWRAASAQFARGASGEVNAFKSGTVFDRTRVFYGLEIKNLAKNPNVSLPIKYQGD
ncbi:RHS repeat-associated core domain-containing protein [Vibrio intestinalis]|uniref:RHS repeat-associated core domain-containing protein n=1 Tax=Vibrio intestinalis TaxID=2933291 RepID=UPI0021A46D91|nr:RHS repeat-associated core domain-containing protein [Vibrio intestinalis]